MTLLRALGLASTAAFALGCGSEAARDPVACPAWTLANDDGACVDRAWTPSAHVGAAGEAGARAVRAAVDGRGLAVLGWQIVDGATTTISVGEETAAGTWTLRDASAALDGSSDPPHVAASGAGEAIVVWKQVLGEAGTVFASQRDASGAWLDPLGDDDRLSFPPTAYEPRAAFGADGELAVVWNQWDEDNYGVAFASRDGQGSWKRPASASDVLSPKSFYSNAPQVALGPGGAALVTWYQSSGGGPLMVYASERPSSDSALSRPDVSSFVSAPGAPVDSHPVANPQPAIGPAGEAAIAWTQEDGEGAIAVYLATRDALGTWTEPADLADAFSVRSGVARCAQVAFGADGDLWVAWYADAPGGRHEVRLAHRDPSGAWIASGDAPLVLSSAGADGITPSIAAGRDGGAIVAWAERGQQGPFAIAAATLRPARDGGAVSITRILSTAADGEASSPSVAVGGPADRALIAWTQGQLGSERVVASSLP